MKGPGHRSKFDVRRVWECPVCHRREKTSGKIINLLCNCTAKDNPTRQTWMKLIEEKPKPPPPPVKPE